MSVRERLVHAAVAQFGKNLERAQVMRAWLTQQIREADDADLCKIADRWDRDEAGKGKRYWRKGFLIGSLVLALGLLFPLDKMSDRSAETLRWTLGLGTTSRLEPHIGKGLSKGELLLVGDPKESRLVQKTKLWQSDPDNPAYFADYATAFYASRKALPPDYFEIASRIDPDNAWFDYFGAAVIADKSFIKLKPPKERNGVPEWKIIKRAEYTRALGIFLGASGKSRCESYEGELIGNRIRLLPQSTPVERAESVAYVVNIPTPAIRLLRLGELVSARAYELESGGDPVEFRHLRDASLSCIRGIAGDDNPTMIHALVARAIIMPMTRGLEKTGCDLGVAEEAPWVSEWRDKMEKETEAKKRRRSEGDEMVRMVERDGSNFISTSLPVVIRGAGERPPISEGELNPGRLQDYANVSVQFSAVALTLLACASIGAFVYRFRSAGTLRIIAAKLESLLTPVDWIWIIGGGILLPVAVVFSIMCFTSLGGWDHGMRMSMVAKWWFRPLPDFVVLFLLMIILPVLLSRWRLASRGAVAFGVRGRSPAGWAIFVLLSGCIGCASFPATRWVVAGLVLTAALWMVVTASRAIFSGAATVFPRVVVSRTVLPAYVAGALCMMASIAGFDRFNQYWFERDEFMRLRPDAPTAIPYEYRLTRQMRADLLKLISE